jgi:hypothetical protein
MKELVTSKITKVLSLCFILRPYNDGLNVVSVAVLEDVFFHWISVQFDVTIERNVSVAC